VYQTEKQIKEFEEKLPADLKATLDTKVTELKDAIASDDTDKMKAGMESLQQEVMKIGQAMYGQGQPGAEAGAPGAGAGAGAGSSSSGKPGDDNVIDAEFTDKKD
jgi:heat shock protein 1/8